MLFRSVAAGSLDGLHYMKMSLDDQIAAAKRAGSPNEVRLLMDTSDKLVGLMQKLSPQYAKAMAEYEAGAIAMRAKTEKLRQLRMARDAAEANAKSSTAPARKQVRKAKAPSGSLDTWLANQAASGRNT